jgi:hypothetical protein
MIDRTVRRRWNLRHLQMISHAGMNHTKVFSSVQLLRVAIIYSGLGEHDNHLAAISICMTTATSDGI